MKTRPSTPTPATPPAPDVDERLLTIDEVAAWLRVARKTVLNWIYTRQIARVKFGRRVLIPHDAVVAFIAARYKPGEAVSS